MKKTLIILLSITFVFTSPGLVYAAEEAVTEAPTIPAEASPATETSDSSEAISNPQTETIELPAPTAETAPEPAPEPAPSQSAENQESNDPEPNNPLDDETNFPYNPEQSSLNNFKKEAGLTGTLRVDNFSGAAVYNLNLEIPAGRKNLNPALNLYYNSHDRSAGSWVGTGWSLDLGYVKRSSREGTDKLYTSEEFALYLNGKTYELIHLNDNLYGARIESDYLKVASSSNSWIVTDTLGAKYYFGQTADARLDNNPVSPTKTFKWLLDKVVDTNNNYYEIEYFKDGGNNQIYPENIYYTGHDLTPGPMQIQFVLEDRNISGYIDYIKSYEPQFLTVTTKRLKEIIAKVNSQDKLKYEFVYTTGENSYTTLLQSITKKGYLNGLWQSLPTTTFAYQDKPAAWTEDEPTNWENIGYFNPDPAGSEGAMYFFDFTSDSWIDKGSWAHNGQGWSEINWAFPGGSGTQDGDVNGDKYIDRLRYSYQGGSWGVKVFLNYHDEQSFIFDEAWTNALPDFMNGLTGPELLAKVTMPDVNGDGLADIVQAYSEQGWGMPPSYTRNIYLNTGSGWQGSYGNFPALLANCDTSFMPPACESRGVQFVDINGDGLVDVFSPFGGGPGYDKGVYLNTGSGWEQEPNTDWVIPDYSSEPYHELHIYGGSRLTDINEDGLIDLVISIRDETYSSSEDIQETYINTGSGWQLSGSWTLGPDQIFVKHQQWDNSWRDQGVRFLDINNDGLMDIVKGFRDWPGSLITQAVYLADGEQANLLSTIANGYGGQTEIEYEASAQYTGTPGQFINEDLPMNLQAVKQITTTDGQGNQIVTTYSYEDGLYYHDPSYIHYDDGYTLNQFAGFGTVTEQTGNQIIKTYYHQGGGIDYYELGEYEDSIYKKGRMFRQEVYQQEGVNQYILSQKVNTWKEEDLADGRIFVYLDATVDYDYLENQPGDSMAGQGQAPSSGFDNQYQKDLLAAQDFAPAQEPQLVSQSEDGWSKIYYLGLTSEQEPIYRLEVYSGSNPNSGELDSQESYGSDSQDGYVYNHTSGAGSSWSNTVNAQVGTGVNSGSNIAQLYNRHYGGIGGPYYQISRVFLPFNTSSLPDESLTITQAQLRIYVDGYGGQVNPAYIVKSTQTGPALTPETYGTLNSESGGMTGVGSSIGTKTANLNSTGRSWISQTGWTNLGIKLDYDFENNQPQQGIDNYSNIKTSESYDPYNPEGLPLLTVTYTLNNSNPTAPTELLTEQQTNPDDVTDQYPEFSAIYNDNDPGDLAVAYNTQVYETNFINGTTTLNLVWDSDWVNLTTQIPVGQRSEEIEYNGTNPLPLDGRQYFWKIRFKDNGGPLTNEGLWSEYAYFYMDGSLAPSAPTGLLTEGKTNPVDLINLTPSFSAIYTDPNPIDMAKWYEIDVATNENFSNLVWDGSKTLLTNLISNGGRSEEIVYNGTPLSYNGLTYFWRIKFWDDEGEMGTEGAWSQPATFAMFDENNVLVNVEARAAWFDYDGYGNVVQEKHYGKVNAANNGIYLDNESDSLKITNYEYADPLNPADYIHSAPKTKTLTDQETDETSQTDLYYDDLAHGLVQYVNLTKEDLDQPGVIYESDYNDYGLVIRKRDPLGNQATTTYDGFNYYPYQTINALSQTVTTTFDLTTGQILSTTDPNGLAEERSYDAFGRLLEVKRTDPANPPALISLETYEYHDTAQPFWFKKSSRVDETNWVDSYTYFDGLGRVIQARQENVGDNQFVVVSYYYNEQGNLAKQSLPIVETGSSYVAPNWSTLIKNEYTYDSAGRVLTEVTPVGTTSYNYSAWQATITDANGNYKNYYRDAYGQLIQVDEVLDSVEYPTTYEYNYLGNLTNITDFQGNSRNFTYDSMGRLLSLEEMHIPSAPLWGVWNFTYDEASNLVSKTDAKSQTVSYTYDDLNRILTEDYTGTTGTDVSYVYDTAQNGIGRLTSVTKNTNPTVSTSYTYDLWGRALTETKNIKDRTFTTGYTYNLSSQPLTITYPETTYPDSFTVRYAYNPIGQTNQVFTQESGQAEQTIVNSVLYSPLGQISQINYTNGTVSQMTYDINQAYRLVDKDTIKGTSTLQDISYTYDNVGNITQITDNVTHQLAKTATYVYDDLYRLTSATIIDNFTPTTTVQTFDYDIIGNILTKSDVGAYQYLYNNPYQSSNVAGQDYSYDNNGNLTADGTRSMVYDYADRMSSVTINNRITNYYYDHSKTRVMKYNPTTGAKTMYPNKYYEKSTDKDNRYIFLGNQRLGIVEKVGEDAMLYLNFTDHLNSSSVTTDSDGTVTNLIDYLPFGTDRVNVQNQGFSPSYKFTDQENDQESGLMNFDSRYFNQNIGRFIQSDPLSLVLYDNEKVKELTQREIEDILSNPQYLNSYAYTLNNPIIYIDPDGNISFRPLFYSTYRALYNYGAFIRESLDAYSSNSSLKILTKYANLSPEERGKYDSYEGFARQEMTKQAGENFMMGMMGGGAGKLEQFAKFYGKSIAQKMIKVGETLSKEGIKITDHALGNIVTQESKGLSVNKVMDVFKSGTKYLDTKWKNVNIIKDNIRLSIDKTGKIINVLVERKINWSRFKELN